MKFVAALLLAAAEAVNVERMHHYGMPSYMSHHSSPAPVQSSNDHEENQYSPDSIYGGNGRLTGYEL